MRMKKPKRPEPEYTVRYDGTRLLDRFRGDEISGDVYTVTKFIAESNDITEYKVTFSTFGQECTCPGGQHPSCKHRKMVEQFRSMPHIEDDKDA